MTVAVRSGDHKDKGVYRQVEIAGPVRTLHLRLMMMINCNCVLCVYLQRVQRRRERGRWQLGYEGIRVSWPGPARAASWPVRSPKPTLPPPLGWSARSIRLKRNGEFGNSCYASGASVFTAVAKVLRIAMNQLGIQLFSAVIGS